MCGCQQRQNALNRLYPGLGDKTAHVIEIMFPKLAARMRFSETSPAPRSTAP